MKESTLVVHSSTSLWIPTCNTAKFYIWESMALDTIEQLKFKHSSYKNAIFIIQSQIILKQSGA